jgi:hypothetical protein
MPVTCSIHTSGNKTLTLPESSFVMHSGKTFVFRLIKSGKIQPGKHSPQKDHEHTQHTYHVFRRVHVKQGETKNGLSALRFYTDIPDTATFIVDNARAVLNEMKSGEGHAHAH